MEIGQVLDDRWEVREYLDKGGMGRLYRGHDPRLGHDVAIKVMTTADVPSAGDIKRFQAEARTMGQVNHPNVLRVYDCNVTPDGELYTVMQLVRGNNLKRVVEGLPHLPSLAAALPVFRQVSSGLHAVHEQGIVHRDIKPANLLLEPGRLDGAAYVGDFGICKSLGDAHSGYYIGTAEYMSREACLTLPVDRRSDVYSLGCTVFECLTGELWNAPRRTTSDHVGPRLAALRPELPPAVARVLESALADEPRDRHATAQAFMADLERASSHRALPSPSPRPRTVIDPEPRPTPPVPPVPPRRRTGALVAGALAAASIAVVGVFAANSALSQPPAQTTGPDGIVSPTAPTPDAAPTTVNPQSTTSAPAPEQAGDPSPGPATSSTTPAPRPWTEADSTLQAQLADGYGHCAPVQLTERLTAFIDCRTAPDDLWSLQLRQYASREAMDASFLESYVSKRDRFSSGRCADWAVAPKAPGRGTISSWDSGGVACFVNVNGHAVVLWQIDDLALQVLAIRSDDDSNAVFDWWLEHRDGVLS